MRCLAMKNQQYLKDDFQEPKTTDENLDYLNMYKNGYEQALSVSDEDTLLSYIRNGYLTHAFLIVTFLKAWKHGM